MRLKTTLLFTGIQFWLGLALLGASASGLLAFELPKPVAAGEGADVLGCTLVLYGTVACYCSYLCGALGLLYVLIGWRKARRAAGFA